MSPNNPKLVPRGAMDELVSKSWMERKADGEAKDEASKPMNFDVAFLAKTERDVRHVLEWAAERDCIVDVVGAASSSDCFDKPHREWLEEQGKKGRVLLELSGNEDSDFSHVRIDEEQQIAHVGAGLSLEEVRNIVDHRTNQRLESPMTITTMDARLVATFMGSGGAADDASDATSLCAANVYMDGRGHRVHEDYSHLADVATYFGFNTFDPVNPKQMALEMMGRGGPFGVGMYSTTRLRPKLDKHRFVLNLMGDAEETQHAMIDSIVELNQRGKELKKAGLQVIKPFSMEMMDRAAIELAWEAGFSSAGIHEDAQRIVILTFAQTAECEDAMEWMYDNGLFLEDWCYDMDRFDVKEVKGEDNVKAVEAFRLAGPDQARVLIKRWEKEGKKVYSTSTDFAVAAWEAELVGEYGNLLFDLQRNLQAKARPGTAYFLGYGHGAWRFDPHVRLVTTDRELYEEYCAEVLALGHMIVKWQKEGRLARIRAEKPETLKSRDLELMGFQRDFEHRESNRRVLEERDPQGLFLHKAVERTIGRR